MKGVLKIELEKHMSEYGNLVFGESDKGIPFSIERIYYIYGVSGTTRRGFHAHKNLKQVLLCVNGSCEILLDDGSSKEIIILNEPNKGISVEGVIWREMYNFTEGTVLLVLASDYYNEEDYIRNYDEFLMYIKGV